jgi:hypothetical protein
MFSCILLSSLRNSGHPTKQYFALAVLGLLENIQSQDDMKHTTTELVGD